MAGARRAAAAAVVVVLVAVVGADASGDSLADLGGAAKEIESAPGTARRSLLSAIVLYFAADRIGRASEFVGSSPFERWRMLRCFIIF
jgi:hypothetical protein